MPVLMKRLHNRENLLGTTGAGVSKDSAAGRMGVSGPLNAYRASSALLPQCGNVKCRSGWMKLWRSRQSPVLEGKWACSQDCMQEIVLTAVLREAGALNSHSSQKTAHQHRVPLGLVLLSRGAITQEQLRKALEAQRKAGRGRLGEWLIRQKAVNEEQVTKALSAQWNCPVLTATPYDPAAMAPAFPR